VSRVGKIVVSPREPVLDCTVVDYSAGGACLEICGPIALPERFELLWGGTKKKLSRGLENRTADRSRFLNGHP
jgi:hypothetical protein